MLLMFMQTRILSWPSVRLRAIEAQPPQKIEGALIAYDFIANLATDKTTLDTPESWYIKPDWLALNGDPRPVLRMQAPSAIYYTIHVPKNAWLHAAAAMDPEVWSPDHGDGVLFIARTIVDGVEKTVFYQGIDSKNRPEDRRWQDFDVDLSSYAGQTITILFITILWRQTNGIGQFGECLCCLFPLHHSKPGNNHKVLDES